MVEFDWSKSIFPLISCRFDKSGLPYDKAVLGTCFFTSIEGYPLIISARHVLNVFKENTSTPCILTRYGTKSAMKLIGAIIEHATMDFAVMVLNQECYNNNRDEFRPIHIKYEKMHLGQDVFAFGYPYAKEPPLNIPDDRTIEVDNLLLKGYISNIIDTTIYGGTKKTYVLSFPVFPGFSGSPLLAFDEKSVNCIGIIYKNHEMLLPPEEKEIRIEGEIVIKHIHRAFYFGWAMDANPLLEINNLLNDFNKHKKDRN